MTRKITISQSKRVLSKESYYINGSIITSRQRFSSAETRKLKFRNGFCACKHSPIIYKLPYAIVVDAYWETRDIEKLWFQGRWRNRFDTRRCTRDPRARACTSASRGSPRPPCTYEECRVAGNTFGIVVFSVAASTGPCTSTSSRVASAASKQQAGYTFECESKGQIIDRESGGIDDET